MLNELSELEIYMTPFSQVHKNLIESGFTFFMFKEKFIRYLIILEEMLHIAMFGPEWVTPEYGYLKSGKRTNKLGIHSSSISLSSPSLKLIKTEKVSSKLGAQPEEKFKIKLLRGTKMFDPALENEERFELAKQLRIEDRKPSTDTKEPSISHEGESPTRIQRRGVRSIAKSIIYTNRLTSPTYATKHPLDTFVSFKLTLGTISK